MNANERTMYETNQCGIAKKVISKRQENEEFEEIEQGSCVIIAGSCYYHPEAMGNYYNQQGDSFRSAFLCFEL